MTVQLAGLEVFGHHGASAAERELGRILEFDLDWDVGDAALSDRLEDTADYTEVAACIREVSDARRYRLLEVLAAAVADEVLSRFPVERVRVRVRKRGIQPGGLPVRWAAASVERRR